MQIESWKIKFFRLSELYLESEGIVNYLCGELKRSRSEIFKRFNQQSLVQQEALQDSARATVSMIISNEHEEIIKVGNNLLKERAKKVLEMRKSRKEQITKKVLELENK